MGKILSTKLLNDPSHSLTLTGKLEKNTLNIIAYLGTSMYYVIAKEGGRGGQPNATPSLKLI